MQSWSTTNTRHASSSLKLAFLVESLAAYAAYAANALPNHQQVIEPAMASLIERMTDQRVWKYWQVENFLARGSLEPEPIANDNVMLTGFYQSQISLCEAATGSTRFDEPGCLKFVWKDGRVFSYDHKSLSEAIVDNLERSNLGLNSCEPTWVFTICNTQAAQGLVGYDRIHGTDYWGPVLPRFRDGLLQEMMTADGAFRHIRTNVLGLSFNDGDGRGEISPAVRMASKTSLRRPHSGIRALAAAHRDQGALSGRLQPRSPRRAMP